MKTPPSFQFYAQDFLTGVVYLTNEEIGIYIKMLSKQWTDGKIPKKRLGLFLGLEWDNFSEELKSKFTDIGEYIYNDRLETEREKKSNFLKTQALNGKKGGRPLKNQAQINPNNNPNETQKKPLEEENEYEIENRNKGFNFRKKMLELGFKENLVVEWIKVRKTKKATNSETALNGFINQVEKTNLDKNIVLKECVERSWAGFNCQWMLEEKKDKKQKRDASDIILEKYGIK